MLEPQVEQIAPVQNEPLSLSAAVAQENKKVELPDFNAMEKSLQEIFSTQSRLLESNQLSLSDTSGATKAMDELESAISLFSQHQQQTTTLNCIKEQYLEKIKCYFEKVQRDTKLHNCPTAKELTKLSNALRILHGLRESKIITDKIETIFEETITAALYAIELAQHDFLGRLGTLYQEDDIESVKLVRDINALKEVIWLEEFKKQRNQENNNFFNHCYETLTEQLNLMKSQLIDLPIIIEQKQVLLNEAKMVRKINEIKALDEFFSELNAAREQILQRTVKHIVIKLGELGQRYNPRKMRLEYYQEVLPFLQEIQKKGATIPNEKIADLYSKYDIDSNIELTTHILTAQEALQECQLLNLNLVLRDVDFDHFLQARFFLHECQSIDYEPVQKNTHLVLDMTLEYIRRYAEATKSQIATCLTKIFQDSPDIKKYASIIRNRLSELRRIAEINTNLLKEIFPNQNIYAETLEQFKRQLMLLEGNISHFLPEHFGQLQPHLSNLESLMSLDIFLPDQKNFSTLYRQCYQNYNHALNEECRNIANYLTHHSYRRLKALLTQLNTAKEGNVYLRYCSVLEEISEKIKQDIATSIRQLCQLSTQSTYEQAELIFCNLNHLKEANENFKLCLPSNTDLLKSLEIFFKEVSQLIINYLVKGLQSIKNHASNDDFVKAMDQLEQTNKIYSLLINYFNADEIKKSLEVRQTYIALNSGIKTGILSDSENSLNQCGHALLSPTPFKTKFTLAWPSFWQGNAVARQKALFIGAGLVISALSGYYIGSMKK